MLASKKYSSFEIGEGGEEIVAESFALLLLAFAVSVDGFSVGFTYGLRKLKLPYRSLVIIATCSAVFFLAAMGVGSMIESVVSPIVAEKLGGIILIVIGFWIVFQSQEAKTKVNNGNKDYTIVHFEIKSLGIVIQVLEKPTVADLDKSGTITGIEALILGIALSLDAIGAGISAALLGYSPFFMSLSVAMMSSIFVLSGMKFGLLFSKLKWIEKFSILPGCLLMLIGVLKLA